ALHDVHGPAARSDRPRLPGRVNDMSQNLVTVPPGADYFTIEREFAAPRILVWKCYTEPQHLARFWGPREATTAATVDLRVGGVWRTVWTYDNGQTYAYDSVYLDLVEPE